MSHKIVCFQEQEQALVPSPRKQHPHPLREHISGQLLLILCADTCTNNIRCFITVKCSCVMWMGFVIFSALPEELLAN